MLTWRGVLFSNADIHHRACGGRVRRDWGNHRENRTWFLCAGCGNTWADDALHRRTPQEIAERFELRPPKAVDSYALVEETEGKKRFTRLVKRGSDGS